MVTIANFTSSTCARGSHYLSSYNAKSSLYFMRGFLFLAAMIALPLKIEIIYHHWLQYPLNILDEKSLHVFSLWAQNDVPHSPSSCQNFYMFFHFSLCKQWQIFKSFTPASCRIIYFANILYLGRGISKRNRAFSGFSLCLVAILGQL